MEILNTCIRDFNADELVNAISFTIDADKKYILFLTLF